MPEFLPRRMRELSIDHMRKSSHMDFLIKCAKYARILRIFCTNLNPFRVFPHITHEREASNFSGDCTVYHIIVQIPTHSIINIDVVDNLTQTGAVTSLFPSSETLFTRTSLSHFV